MAHHAKPLGGNIFNTMVTAVTNVQNNQSATVNVTPEKLYMVIACSYDSNGRVGWKLLNKDVVGGELIAWYSADGTKGGVANLWFQVALIRATQSTLTFGNAGNNGLYYTQLD